MHRVLPRSVLLPVLLLGWTAWVCRAATLQFSPTPALWLANGLLVGVLLNRARAHRFTALPLAGRWFGSTCPGSTGLGMAIAKRLTEGMAGTISYESEEGQGTTFHLEFELAEKESRE